MYKLSIYIVLSFTLNCLNAKKAMFDFSSSSGSFLVGFFSNFFPTSTNSLTITSVSISGTDTNAKIVQDINISFSEEIDLNSFSANSVQVIDANGLQISNSVSQGTNANNVIISLNVLLSYNASYQLKLSTEVKSKAGKNLASEYLKSFTTTNGIEHFTNSSSLNNDTIAPLGYIIHMNLQTFSNKIYLAWTENADANTSATTQLFVKSIDQNKVISSVGTNLNYSANNSESPNMVSYNSKLYLSWKESTQIRVKVFDGNSWTSADGNASLTDGSPLVTERPILYAFNSKLYSIWGQEIATSHRKIRVKEYDGSTWTFVDNGYLNSKDPIGTDGAGHKPDLVSFQNVLYAGWLERNNSNSGIDVRIKKYNGNNSWSFVDNGGIQYSTGVSENFDSVTPFPISLVVHNNKLYAFWLEKVSSVYIIRGKVYNGNDSSPSWISIDGGGSLNYSKNTYSSFNLKAMSHNNRLYLLWQELRADGKTQIRLLTYNNNDNSPSWFFVDSNPTSSNGLTFNAATNSTTQGSLIGFNDYIYVSWSELVNSNQYNLYISKMPF